MKWLTTLLVMVLVGPVLADPVDPDPNGVGIFFDPGAIDQSWCATAAEGSQVTAYLCLTRASDPSGLTAWEASIEASVGSALAGFNIVGGGLNQATAPEFVVTYETPLPYLLSTVLLEITLDVVWEWSIGMRVWPASQPSGDANLPAYATVDSPDTFQTMQYSFGWDMATEIPNWCAAINDDTCSGGPSVPNEDVSWEGVKALYR